MKSKKMNIKWMLPTGIVVLIISIYNFILCALNDNDKSNGNITHIGGDSGSVTIISNINWWLIVSIIGSIILMIIGACLISFYACCKRDFINIENGVVVFRGNLKDYKAPITDIEYCKTTGVVVLIKRKFDEKPIPIFFIKNGYDIASYINNAKVE